MSDLVREAIQIHVNELGAATGEGGWLVAHYIAVAGLYRVNAEGVTETGPIIVAPLDQPTYVSDGLLSHAPFVLAAHEEDCDSETD